MACLAFDKQKLGPRWVDLFQSSKVRARLASHLASFPLPIASSDPPPPPSSQGELYSLTAVGGIMMAPLGALHPAADADGAAAAAAVGGARRGTRW